MSLNVKKKILLIGSQHGDETLGIRLYEYLSTTNKSLLSSVEYYCANPLAFARGTRFVDVDMNRSYRLKGDQYEVKQANLLLDKIHENNYRYVIDCHTTTTPVGLCFIVANRNKKVDSVINSAPSINHIIMMPRQIANQSLLGNVDNAVSLECNDELSTREATLNTLATMLSCLSLGKLGSSVMRDIYYVDGFMSSKENIESKKLRNFSEHNGRYPILHGGQTSRRTYKGFWAERKEEVLI